MEHIEQVYKLYPVCIVSTMRVLGTNKCARGETDVRGSIDVCRLQALLTSLFLSLKSL